MAPKYERPEACNWCPHGYEPVDKQIISLEALILNKFPRLQVLSLARLRIGSIELWKGSKRILV